MSLRKAFYIVSLLIMVLFVPLSVQAVEYAINPGRTALLIIDAQRVYSDVESPLYVSDFVDTINNINRISAASRSEGIPVFTIKHVYDSEERNVGRLGDFDLQSLWMKNHPLKFDKFDPGLEREESDIKIKKSRFSVFMNTRLESYLKAMGIDTVIVTGFMTQFCSVTAARYAHDLDYKVIYVNDANSGPSLGDVSIEDIKRVVHAVLSTAVAEVIDTDTLLSRIK